MVKKKRNKFGYTRQYHISLSYQQIDLYEKAIETQNELYQFALKYLYKTYAVNILADHYLLDKE